MMAFPDWVTKANRKLNDRFFPKSQIRYVSRFRDMASTLSRNVDLVLHLGSGPKDLGPSLEADAQNVRAINLDLGLQGLQKTPGALKVCANAETNAEMLPFAENQVGAICSEHVFEHFASPERVLAECFRILKPGGYLVVSGPNRGSYVALAARFTSLRFHKKIRRFNSGGRECGDAFHTFYRFSTPRTMCRLARQSGLEVVGLERFVGEPCYTTFLPVLHLFFIAYHLILEKLCSLFGFHMTTVAVFRKPLHIVG